jgi:hypothetical protein
MSDREIDESPVVSLNSLDTYENIDLFKKTSIKEPALTSANPFGLINDTLQQLEAIPIFPTPQSDKDSLYDV